MKKEDLIKRGENEHDELNCADSQSSLLSSQVVEMKKIDHTSLIEGIEDQSGRTEASYILDLITSLNKQGKELNITQTEVQTLLEESGELLSEYEISVKIMKEKLADRIIKLRMPKK